jgi:hypothetical protein
MARFPQQKSTHQIVTRQGGCACGLVRFEASGEPVRVGLCHCITCRKKHGSAFNPFAVFSAHSVLISGTLQSWRSSDHACRMSCAVCASSICMHEDGADMIELNLGSFDDASVFAPMYENWVVHREAWLPPLGIPGRQTDPGFEARSGIPDLISN